MDGYHTNQDGQWKTSDQWRAEEANTSNKKPKKSGRGKYAAKLVASAVAFGLIAGLVMQGVTYGFSKAGIGNGATQLATTKTTSSSSSTSSEDLSGVSSNVMPSIVSITGKFETTSQSWFGQTQSSESEGVGSGIIIGKKDGKILIATNNHVVVDAKSLSVGFVDGKSASATIRGTDSDADLAVVEVNTKDMKASTLKKIAVITLGDSSKLKTGERAIAIGNALGYGQSVTGGYISALNRQVQLTDKTMTLVQTSAAINPGNSGGALLNGKGEVIGMNTVKYSDTSVEGMGYAIPINTALETAKGIIDGTIVAKTDETTAFLGITGGTLDEDTASAYNAPAGIYVSNVASGSAAQRAGLQAGCIITGFNGEDVSTMEDLQKLIQNCAPGDSVTITAQFPDSNGNYSEQTLTTIMGSKADAEDSSQSTQQNGQNQQNGQYGQGQQYGQ